MTKFVQNPQFITNHKFIVHKFTSSIHRNYSASGSQRLRPSVRSRRRSGCGWPDLRCRRPSDLVRRRPRCPLHKKEDIAREWQDKNVRSLKKSWKFRQHLPCTGTFPKPARKTSARRPTTTFPARRPTHQQIRHEGLHSLDLSHLIMRAENMEEDDPNFH